MTSFSLNGLSGWIPSFPSSAHSCFCSAGLGEVFASWTPMQHPPITQAQEKKGQFGFVQGSTYFSCFEIEIQERFSSRKLQPSSPSLLSDKLKHFPDSGDSINNKAPKIYLLSRSFFFFFCLDRSFVSEQPPLYISAWSNSRLRVLSPEKQDSWLSTRNIWHYKKLNWKGKARNQLSTCLLPLGRKDGRKETLDKKVFHLNFKIPSWKTGV